MSFWSLPALTFHSYIYLQIDDYMKLVSPGMRLLGLSLPTNYTFTAVRVGTEDWCTASLSLDSVHLCDSEHN